MQRSHLTTVLASLGLACAPEPGSVVEPEVEVEPPTDGEPSGFGRAAKPEVASTSRPSEPHFAGVPTHFCHATVQQRDETVLRTESFLSAWKELAPPVRNPNAHNIPTTEIDARFALCGTEQCSIGSEAKLAEAIADYMVGTGVLIPSQGAMLVVPELAVQHVVGGCTNKTEISVERHGRFVHVRALTREQRYTYGHYGHESYGYNYAPVPVECQTYSTIRRDLVIDEEDGELELVIDQTQANPDALPWIELSFDQGNIVLSGCASALELQWTE
jgi:hypothetical protein